MHELRGHQYVETRQHRHVQMNHQRKEKQGIIKLDRDKIAQARADESPEKRKTRHH